jgi:hypothetical protein
MDRCDRPRIRNLQYPWFRWGHTLLRIKARYSDAYNERRSSVSWNLVIGRNPPWVTKNHGHSVQTMLEKYAAWTEGATDADVEAIKQAMGFVSAAAPARGPVDEGARGNVDEAPKVPRIWQ